jgi:hypothetical protein
MNEIEMALVGNKIAITLRSKDDECARTRHISLESAVDLSLLLCGGAFYWALRFQVDPGVALQIMNLPYEVAFISIIEKSRNIGFDLDACIKGEAVAEIGRLLNDLVEAAKGRSKKAKMAVHVRPVAHCHLTDGSEEEPD